MRDREVASKFFPFAHVTERNFVAQKRYDDIKFLTQAGL